MSRESDVQKVPTLRFPQFLGEWRENRVDWFLKKAMVPVKVDKSSEYREIGVRSHGKGVFHKEPCSGESLGEKRVFWVTEGALVLNIVFAWEQAVALTSENERGFIASHRFPMFVSRKERADTRFVRDFFLKARGKYLLRLASPGGAGRNKTLGQSDFASLIVVWPDRAEQTKVADFISTVTKRIELLEKREQALIAYKNAIVQHIFSQRLRFLNEGGSYFPDWEEKRLSDVLSERRDRSTGKESVHSVSVRRGIVDQLEHLGRSFAAANTSHYKLVKPGDIVYTKSPTSGFPFGVIKQSRITRNAIVSPLYGVFKPKTYSLGYMLNEYFLSVVNTNNYLNRLVHKGAKNTINISNSTFLEGHLRLPIDHEEQKRIADFISPLCDKVEMASRKLNAMRRFKRALLQQMYV